MTTVAVVGGTGTIGAPVVAALLARGADVRVLTRGTTGFAAGAEHRRVDLTSGAGLGAALSGADAVVDAANSTRRSRQTIVAGTRRLLAAEAAAGVGHHLTISIVGIEQVPSRYYRDKLAQEAAVEAGSVPWSILRATQFHQLLDLAFGHAARFGVRPTGAGRLQPIDPRVVAERLADAALGPPAGRLPDVAGPRIATIGELGRAWAVARGRRRVPLRVPSWGKAGKALAAGALCAPDGAAGGEDFEEWLRHG
ncbi:MAG TPA: NAD(P)H-binding protein [Solirubrobacterales bacterium]|nr:NAD(P)H-binding protein [Solirubrobacterales bacterium]